jgi:hypothetical protein
VHLVAEGADLQLVQESSLGGFDLEASSDNLLVGDDFNLGLHDLGLDVQLLEEAGLLGVETSGASANPHIIRGDGANLGGCLTSLLVEDLLDVGEITVGKDDSGVSLEELNDGVKLVALLP